MLILSYFELEAGVKILPAHIDRKMANFLLDPVVLLHIRKFFVNKENKEREAEIRARLLHV